MEFWKKFKRGSVLFCIAELLIGAFMAFSADIVKEYLAYAVGGVLVLLGIVGLIRFFNNKSGPLGAVVEIVIGALFIFLAKSIISKIFSIVFGTYFTVKGLLMLLSAFLDRKYFKKGAIAETVFAVVTVVFGTVLFLVPASQNIFFILGGAFLMANGVLDLINLIAISGKITRKLDKIRAELEDISDYDGETLSETIIDIEAKELNDD